MSMNPKPHRSLVERRAQSDRRQSPGIAPDGNERRVTDRRTALMDRRSENNIQLATFHLSNELFGIEVGRVQEIVRPQQMTPVPTAERTIRGLINLRGQIVTAIDLRRILGMNDTEKVNEQMNMIVRFPEGSDSLLVDRIGDVVEVAANHIDPPPSSMKGIDRRYVSGVCKLEKSLLVILDVDRLTGRVE
jgi:purine-binding chemotaxis protein CheW